MRDNGYHQVQRYRTCNPNWASAVDIEIYLTNLSGTQKIIHNMSWTGANSPYSLVANASIQNFYNLQHMPICQLCAGKAVNTAALIWWLYLCLYCQRFWWRGIHTKSGNASIFSFRQYIVRQHFWAVLFLSLQQWKSFDIINGLCGKPEFFAKKLLL